MSEEKKENEAALAEALDKLNKLSNKLEAEGAVDTISEFLDGYSHVTDGYVATTNDLDPLDFIASQSFVDSLLHKNRGSFRSEAVKSHIENSEYIEHYPVVKGKRLVKNVYLNRTCTTQRLNARNQELEDAKKFYEKRNTVSWFQKLFGKKQAVVDKTSEIEMLVYYRLEYRKNIFSRTWDFIVNNTQKAMRFIARFFQKKSTPSQDDEQLLRLMLKVEKLKKAYRDEDEAKDDVKITTDEDKK